MINTHLISYKVSVLDALKQINLSAPDPLVLFVVDEAHKMVGTLTDGDVRRALISGHGLDDSIEKVMRHNFNFIRLNEGDIVRNLQQQRELKMKLVPILDANNHIVEIVDLEKYRTQIPIDAVLMAGGKGERLRPLTEKTPKPLLPVGNKCIIDHNIDHLISYGVKNISVTCNYLKEQLYEHFETPRGEVKINCVTEPKFLGTIGSIKFVEIFRYDTILVMNSDLFTDINYEDFYLHFKEHDADMSVAAVPYTVNIPYGVFELEGRNIKGLNEKPTYHHYANAGVYLIKKDLLQLIPDNTYYNATDLIEHLIGNNYKVVRFPITGYWIDIGKPEDYSKAQELVKHL
jgi:dTDP-glucose pyrophosphorylase